MAALDWILAVLLLGSLLLGAWRGLVFELLSLAGWVGAFIAAQWFADDMAALLPMQDAMPAWRHLAGFALVFVLAVFVFGLLAWLAKRLVQAVGLRPADRALGALFGSLRGVVLLLVFALVLSWTPLRQAPWWQQSYSAPLLENLLLGIKPALPQEWQQHLPATPV